MEVPTTARYGGAGGHGGVGGSGSGLTMGTTNNSIKGAVSTYLMREPITGHQGQSSAIRGLV